MKNFHLVSNSAQEISKENNIEEFFVKQMKCIQWNFYVVLCYFKVVYGTNVKKNLILSSMP